MGIHTDRQTDRHKHTHTHQAKSVGTHTQPLPHGAALLGKLRLTPSSPGNRFSAQRMNIKMSSFFTPFPLLCSFLAILLPSMIRSLVPLKPNVSPLYESPQLQSSWARKHPDPAELTGRCSASRRLRRPFREQLDSEATSPDVRQASLDILFNGFQVSIKKANTL